MIMGSEPVSVHQGVLVGKSFVFGPGIVIELTKLAAGSSVLGGLRGHVVDAESDKGRESPYSYGVGCPSPALAWEVPTEKMNALAWGIGGSTVTVAGALLVNFWPVDPNVGLLFTMIAFTTVALGGFGSIPGAAFAGLIVGILINLAPIWDAVGAFTGSETLLERPIAISSSTRLCIWLIFLLWSSDRGGSSVGNTE